MVGLGNPGDRYAQTRHNVGFMLLDRMAKDFGGSWAKWRQDLGEHLEAFLDGSKVVLAKPLTYMNESGRLVGDLARYTNTVPQDVLVVYDDFALPLGRLRLRLKGSAGGHNGMRSIIGHLGTEEFPRLRIGIGPVDAGRDPKDFVLGKFRPAERQPLEKALELAEDAVKTSVRESVTAAMNRFNPEPAA